MNKMITKRVSTKYSIDLGFKFSAAVTTLSQVIVWEENFMVDWRNVTRIAATAAASAGTYPMMEAT
jgi:hypothetical protein